MKASFRVGEKYLQTTYYTKYWYLECIVYSQNSMVRKQTTRLEKEAKDISWHFTEETTQMANKYMKRYSTSSTITEIQTKSMHYRHTPIRLAKIQITTTQTPEMTVRNWITRILPSIENGKWYSPLKKLFGSFLKPNVQLSYHPATGLQEIYPGKTKTYVHTKPVSVCG